MKFPQILTNGTKKVGPNLVYYREFFAVDLGLLEKDKRGEGGGILVIVP